jgi:hypothetical protein
VRCHKPQKGRVCKKNKGSKLNGIIGVIFKKIVTFKGKLQIFKNFGKVV